MSTPRDPRPPAADEYAPFYRDYVTRVPEGDVVDFLAVQGGRFEGLFEGVPEERGDFRYAPEKWSLKEVVGHVLDAEWVFTYRALRFARGDGAPLVGMDQDEFVAGANFEDRSLSGLLQEFHHLRAANQLLFQSFGEEQLARQGTASGFGFTVRSMLFVIAGHCEHHMKVLEQRYF